MFSLAYNEHRQYGCVDCNTRPFPNPPDNTNEDVIKQYLSMKHCCFYVKTLGKECVKKKSFGYLEGKPCVLLKLNRIYGWLPQLYANKSEAPEEFRDRFHEKHIGVKCFGIVSECLQWRKLYL